MQGNTSQSTPSRGKQRPDGNILHGYDVVTAVTGEKYLVPRHLVPDVERALATEEKCQELNVHKNKSQPRTPFDPGTEKLERGLVEGVSDPGLSDREWLALHAEIKALQQQLGLSYKDSAHRLYIAEVEKLKALNTGRNSVLEIRQRIDTILDHELIPPLSHIDTGTSADNHGEE